MAKGKIGRPRTDSMKLHLALPKDLGEWLEEKAEETPFCRSRQDYIVGVLNQLKKREQNPEQLELAI